MTKDLWLFASDGFRNAQRIFIIGYSFPQADASMTGLLRTSVSNRKNPPPEVSVINKKPVEIVKRLNKIGITVATSFQGATSVKRFADSYTGKAAKLVAKRLQGQLSQAIPYGGFKVSWGNAQDQFCPIDSAFEVSVQDRDVLISVVLSQKNDPELVQINTKELKVLMEHLADRKFERILFKFDEK